MKKSVIKTLILFVSFCVVAGTAIAQDKLLDIMKKELNRNMNKLNSQEVPPYYMCYRVTESSATSIKASFGVLSSSNENKSRKLTVQVRVGNYELDNFHELRDDYSNFLSFTSDLGKKLPLDNDPDAISQVLWQETNEKFMAAADKYAKVKANIAIKVAEEDKSADFSKSEAVNHIEAQLKPEEIYFDKTVWEEKVKIYSRVFFDDPDIFVGGSSVSFSVERKYFVSSDGSIIAQNRTAVRLFINGTIKSEDGMELPLYKSYFAHNPKDLPSDEEVLKDAKGLVKKLIELKASPIVDSYSGPALMSGEAAGVFFHEIFGHRIEGHRLKSESDAQTFKKKVGKKVLPKTKSVTMKPTLKNFSGQDLNGYFLYDDEGVKAEDVVIVKNGILKGFLMSRSLIENFSKSNGHGRAQAGKQPVTRQSNLIVETTKPYSKDKLRKMLKDEAKKQGKEYGYLFQSVVGGFTTTGRFMPNAFNVTPTEVYRIYTDGRPDELVRGVDLVGTPLAMFSQIEATGDDPKIFTGTCGAESGRVPVTAVSPTLFVKQIEMQRKSKSQDRPPILPRPDTMPE